MAEVTINGDRAWPIYHISSKWVEDNPKYNPSRPLVELFSGEKPTRKNSTSVSRIYKEFQSLEVLEKEYRQRVLDREDSANPVNIEVEAKFVGYETWCLSWFQHETPDIGQSDDESLESFGRFVLRTKDFNYWHSRRVTLDSGSIYDSEPRCLMGAEDEYRWHGTKDGESKGTSETRTDPPCRCKFCKEQGVIRIAH